MVYPKAVRVGDSPNQDPRRASVSQVILHHTASTGDVEEIWNMFMQPNSRDVSANFLIAQNGDVYEVVNPDTGRAWTTGSGPGGTLSPDHSAITMECMDEEGAPGWTQSAASQEAIAEVIAWAAERYGFDPVRGVNVRGHREMPGQSTACPGGMPMDSITVRAIEILNGGGSSAAEEAAKAAAAKAAADKKRRNNVALPLIAQQGNPNLPQYGLNIAVWDNGLYYWLNADQRNFYRDLAGAQFVDCTNPGHFEFVVNDAEFRKAANRGASVQAAAEGATNAYQKLLDAAAKQGAPKPLLTAVDAGGAK